MRGWERERGESKTERQRETERDRERERPIEGRTGVEGGLAEGLNAADRLAGPVHVRLEEGREAQEGLHVPRVINNRRLVQPKRLCVCVCV